MLKINAYFEGNVKSIGFTTPEGRATAGVMEAGLYQFDTSTKEIMIITSGELHVQLPGEKEWKVYKPFEQFEVAKDVVFAVKAVVATSYVCYYR
jgi:purine/pyrimidine-nucleoside phosphorylase